MSLAPVTAQEVRAFRQGQGWTQQAMADALAVSKRAVEQWEGGQNVPPPMLRLVFAAVAAGTEPWSQ